MSSPYPLTRVYRTRLCGCEHLLSAHRIDTKRVPCETSEDGRRCPCNDYQDGPWLITTTTVHVEP